MNQIENDGRAMVVRDSSEDVQEAIRYVVSGQGEPMQVYLEELL